ncbi:lipopolysaccharide biosynthesis protein [Aquipseudomonas alcaligenes]|nr:oligosaccharide flippase family protein [Pseudomonas alcaligenes]
MLARAVRAPLWLLVSALMARVMGPESLGSWAMLLAAGMFLNQVFVLWTQSITQRFGRLEWEASGQLRRTWATRWPLLLFGGVLVLACFLLAPLEWLSVRLGVPEDGLWLIIPIFISLWLMGETQGLQQVRERYLRLAWSPLAADLLLIGLLGALALMAILGQRLTSLQILTAVSLSGAAAWIFMLARELKGSSLGWGFPEGKQVRLALTFSLPLLPGYLVGYLSEWCDYVLISRFIDTKAVGVYHPAYQYMLIMVGLPTAVVAVLMPQLVSRVEKVGVESERQLIGRVAPQIMSLWVLATIGVIAFLPALFSWLVGSSFEDSRVILQILLAAVPGAAATHLYGLGHFVQGRLLTANVGLFGLKLLVNILLTLILLPIFGVLGAAIAALAGFILVQWLFLIDQHRYLKLPFAGGAMALLLAHLGGVSLVVVDGFWARSLASALIILCMLALVRRANFFSPEEVSAMVPASLSRTAPVLVRLLCREGMPW